MKRIFITMLLFISSMYALAQVDTLKQNHFGYSDRPAVRQFFKGSNLIVNITALSKVHIWFGGRLKLDLVLPTPIDTVVSRDRVNGFKNWLGGNNY